RASMWCEKYGFLEEAIEYAFAAGDLARAAWLTEKGAEELLRNEGLVKIQGWMRRLSYDLISIGPHLCVAHALMLLAGGQFDAFEQHMRVIDSSLSEIEGWSNQAEHALLEGEF